MKNILSIGILFLFGYSASAQIVVENASVKKVKRNVEVRFEVHERPEGMHSRQKMVLLPYLYGGRDTLWLAPARIYGKIRYKRERQEAALNGERHWMLKENEALWKKDTLCYASTAVYERWMKRASLGVAYYLEGCGCNCCNGNQSLLNNAEVYTPPVISVTEVAPQSRKFEVVEAKKQWSFRDEMRIYFPLSVTVLHLDRYNNRRTLDEIVATIRKINDMDKLRLQGVEITGFASPEGGLEMNTRLGAKRAESLKGYIQEAEPSLKDDDFHLINGVENWEGLRALVEASDMEFREEVLAILDNERGKANWKTILMKLAGGKPYRYMLDNFYPQLRNACYVSVYYDMLGDKAADAVNTANGLIREGKYAEALQILLEYQKDDRAFNSIGVCHMMLENEEEAIGWFERALLTGHEEARKNLEQLK